MDVTIHLKRLPGDETGTPVYVPHLPCSRRGLPSSISHLMDWCAFTAPFHLYNAQLLYKSGVVVYSLLALSIALPLLGVTQHPALWSPDFPHPDGKITLGTRPSTQLKSFYYNPSGNLNAMKSERLKLFSVGATSRSLLFLKSTKNRKLNGFECHLLSCFI